MYAEIILKNSLFESFYYRLPDHLVSLVEEGFAVFVPLKTSIQIGFIKRIIENNTFKIPDERLRDVLDIFPINPLFDKKMFELLLWASDYYIEPPGNLLFSALPAGIFRLSNYRLVFNDENNIIGKKSISLVNSESLKKRYHIGFVDIYNYLNRQEAKLEVYNVSDDSGSRIVLTNKYSGIEYSEEDKRVIERYPSIEIVLNELRSRGSMPLFDVLTILRDRRILRYLYKKGIIKVEPTDMNTSSYNIKESPVISLTNEQRISLENIERLRKGNFGVHYIYGVTGSGKTEIYLRVAENVLKEGKTVLFMVPEIGLTPQSIFRIKSFLSCDVAVLHSGLNEKERIKEFLRIKAKKVNVVVGARSAVFAPLSNLGLIVVDEEHDNAYKQEESPRYNGRDIAIKRAQLNGCIAILGSATPSVQSIYNIRTNKFEYSRLSQRANKKPLPDIEIVNLLKKGNLSEDVEGLPFFISEELYRALIETINNNRKAILMINRRGFNTVVICSKCGMSFKCPNCDINMIYHKKANILLCHYCNHSEKIPDICPNCGSLAIKSFGFGTEQVEEAVKRLIPGSKTIRLDRDSVANLYDLESMISGFSRGDSNIMIGTQMVAKGHHFPDVTLVGVVLADTAFSVPDFRVQERLMQLLMQVSGRAGRGEEKGKVIIQTFNPFEPAILAVKNNNPDEYIEVELKRRKNLFYPPFSKIILIRTRSFYPDKGEIILNKFRDALLELKHSEVLGPVASPLPKIKNEYRHQLMIKTTEIANVRKTLKNLIPDIYKMHHNVRVNIDVDPVNML